MIHQFIFASPKPGMTEAAFQDYWVNTHAVRYASKIPQVRKYIVDTRVPTPWDEGEPEFSGIAEMWLEPEELVPALQSREFLQGARLDEPNWAAFWKTVVMLTTAREVIPGDEKPASGAWTKSVTLYKRRAGMSLASFRDYAAMVHAPRVAEMQPALTRYLHCQTIDGDYHLGEARFDAIDVCCYANVEAMVESVGRTRYYAPTVMAHLAEFVELGTIFQMVVTENWIIGPEPRITTS